jgi:hypothetical protein
VDTVAREVVRVHTVRMTTETETVLHIGRMRTASSPYTDITFLGNSRKVVYDKMFPIK